jgi:hypothetical protein
MRNFLEFLNESRLFKSQCSVCGENNTIVIIYRSTKLGEIDIESDGTILNSNGQSMKNITLNDIKNDIETNNNYNTFYACNECEDESSGSVVIDGKRYKDSYKALKKIIAMSEPPEIIKDENIEWY